MRPETTSTHGDRRAVATVGMAMAVLSAAVASSGLAIPLPEVIYRAAAVLGELVEQLGGDPPRETVLTGVVSLTPAEIADRNARQEAVVRVARWVPHGPTTRARPYPAGTTERVSTPLARRADRTRAPERGRAAGKPVVGSATPSISVDVPWRAEDPPRTSKESVKPKPKPKAKAQGVAPVVGDGPVESTPPTAVAEEDGVEESASGSGSAPATSPPVDDTTVSPSEQAPCPEANGNGRAYGLCK